MFSTFTLKIWIDYLENNTKEQGKWEAQCQNGGLKSTIYYKLSLRQPFATTEICMRQTCDRITIPAICKLNFLSVKAVILTTLWHYVHQIKSKTSKQLPKSFYWQQIFFWPNVKEAVILIRATREKIFSLMNTMLNCRNI